MVDRRTAIRALVLAVALVSLAVLVHAGLTADTARGDEVDQTHVPGHDGTTVITAHGDAAKSKLLTYGPDGEVGYVNSTYDRYFDVDPVPGTRSVEYVAAAHVYGDPCPPSDPCTLNVVERLNLSTGTVDRVYARYTPGIGETRWHDVDRIGTDRLLVGGIRNDRAFIVNTTTGLITWQWEAQSHFRMETGHSWPEDWTHVNDVEYLPEGRVMVSARNQDRLVFVEPDGRVDTAWTLGAEDDYEIINEQHNADYIPADRGGPAVLVSDSHNNRIAEYQREDGAWNRTWTWRDERMQWPRDADRLPDGGTLITDSNGNRVFKANASGAIDWSVDVEVPYEAERLGTGDESANGSSAAALGLQSRRYTDPVGEKGVERDGGGGSIVRSFWLSVRSLLPSLLTNAVLYVLPPWVRFAELTAMGALGGSLALWIVLEYRWSAYRIVARRPIVFRER
jgi:hypothetical protein